MNDAQLKALLRKTQAAAAAAKPKKNRTYDATLDATRPPTTEEGEAADAELFEIRHLQPGKAAPDILGDDIDGQKFKLSDYRGKVVLLDFWGDW